MANPMFRRQHYCAVADLLRVQLNRAQNKRVDWQPTEDRTAAHAAMETLNEGVQEFADMFERDNPRFKRDLFLAVVRGERPVNARKV